MDEFNGLLQLSQFEISRRDKDGSDVPMLAREVLYIGAENEGYFTAETFCAEVSKAAKIAAFKYPPRIYDVIFVFDQAKIHTAFDDDALIASRMNVGPGGKQPVMRPIPSYLINGAPQRMTLDDGIPKGLKIVPEERGVNTKGMGKVDMVKKLSSFIDFRHEKNKVERLLRRYEMQAFFYPNFILSLTQ